MPALAYSPILVEEPIAYPVSTLALWLIARTLVRPSWGRGAVALAGCAAAALTRTQLAVLFAVFALGLLWLAWQSAAGKRWRSAWGTWDWVGLAVLVVGIAFAFSALMGHLSTSWRETTGFYKDRVFDHGVWAFGALSIGIGILPALLGIAALARPDGIALAGDHGLRHHERRGSRGVRVVRGIKGAYIQNVFATVVVERNVIYLARILFASTAMASRVASGEDGRSPRPRHSRYSSSRARHSISPSTRSTRHTASRSRPSRTVSSAGRRARSRPH